MKKRIITYVLLLAVLLCLCSCSKPRGESKFQITFIDVGQGDAALVKCDGRFMLIDGGDTTAGETVSAALTNNGVKTLDILAISHPHKDHIGGLPEALKVLQGETPINLAICNATETKSGDTNTLLRLNHALSSCNTKITVPAVGETYKLGSATVEVIDSTAREDNDSLVLLITYGDTRFLFTGDIMMKGQLRVREYLSEHHNRFDGVSLIKMPHHGAYNDIHGFQDSNLNALFYVYNPSYVIISVGDSNQYGHPHDEALKVIEDSIVRVKGLDWDDRVFRTDERGDIVVTSDGTNISVNPFKKP